MEQYKLSTYSSKRIYTFCTLELCHLIKKMDFPKYDGNIHPDEWINNVKAHFNHEWYIRSLVSAKSLLPELSYNLAKIVKMPAQMPAQTLYK